LEYPHRRSTVDALASVVRGGNGGAQATGFAPLVPEIQNVWMPGPKLFLDRRDLALAPFNTLPGERIVSDRKPSPPIAP